MNLSELVNKTEIFIAQWAGTTMPRIFVAFVGILVCLWIGMAIWEKRIRILGAVAGMALGLFLILIAIDPRILRFLADTSFLDRIRIMMIVLSFLVVIITIEAIRRSHLQERYAILWVTTGLIILMTAFFPHVLDLFSFLLGTQYVTSVVGIVFTFLLLIAFHFSIALSGMQKKQTQIAQRCAILEAKLEELSNQVAGLSSMRKVEETGVIEKVPSAEILLPAFQSPETTSETGRAIRQLSAPRAAAYAVISLAFLAVLTIGIITPQAMIGDEVTHYYMLVDQSKVLPTPNFHAHIPTGWGKDEVRLYPHSCLWHYLGAMVYRATGGSFQSVQIYHALFWLQFLCVAFLLARMHSGENSRAPVLYLLVLASLPISLIFSVAFYQDIPMAAQVLTSFYLLKKRKWIWASVFLAVAIAMKVSALLFAPAFLLLMAFWEYKAGTWRHAVTALLISVLILSVSSWGMGSALWKYAGARYYPVEQFQKITYVLKSKFSAPQEEKTSTSTQESQKAIARPSPASSEKAQAQRIKAVTTYEAKIIANHPGDLRIPENFFIYGGGILWIVIIAGGVALIYRRLRRKHTNGDATSSWWLFAVGVWYIVTSAYLLRTAPDARFFLPGLPFILLPFVEGVVTLPRPRIIIAIVAAMAILQGGQVLKKAYDLRNVSSELKDAISFLQKNPVEPPLIFMYPEGNYRLFPYAHDWYLNYKLREFWKGDNDVRIEMLHKQGIGALVIKKHLIADVDDAITNLGVYPTYFVRDVDKDMRFRKVFDNRDVVIYKVP